MLQWHKGSWAILNRALWGADLSKGIWDVCTKPDAAVQVWHVSAHFPPTLPGNHEADTLARARALLLEGKLTLSDAVGWVQCKSGH